MNLEGNVMRYKTSLTVLFLVVILGSLAACNTVKGIGQDITGSAQGVQNIFDKKTYKGDD